MVSFLLSFFYTGEKVARNSGRMGWKGGECTGDKTILLTNIQCSGVGTRFALLLRWALPSKTE